MQVRPIIKILCCLFFIGSIVLIIIASVDKPVDAQIETSQNYFQAEDEGGNTHAIPDLTKDWEEIMVQAVVDGNTMIGMEAENQYYWMQKLGYKDHVLKYYDIYDLAKIMQEEDGVNWPDWAIMAIGEVVLNRVKSDEWPNTVTEVLEDKNPIQYAPVYDGGWDDVYPEEKYVRLAIRLLKGESVFNNDEVVWQALFEQGKECIICYNDVVLGTTTHFCW